eukprot:3528477-Karenia_brevis.AAC.1
MEEGKGRGKGKGAGTMAEKEKTLIHGVESYVIGDDKAVDQQWPDEEEELAKVYAGDWSQIQHEDAEAIERKVKQWKDVPPFPLGSGGSWADALEQEQEAEEHWFWAPLEEEEGEQDGKDSEETESEETLSEDEDEEGEQDGKEQNEQDSAGNPIKLMGEGASLPQWGVSKKVEGKCDRGYQLQSSNFGGAGSSSSESWSQQKSIQMDSGKAVDQHQFDEEEKEEDTDEGQ